MITVIVICYNQKDSIRKCLDSILSQQTSFEMKVLVGDDGSTDGTSEIVAHYGDNYSRVEAFVRPKNMGPAENYFDLVDRVETPYVTCLEGDDYWIHDRKLERQVQTMERMPDVSLCFTEHHIEKDGLVIPNYMFKSKRDYTTRDVLFRDPPHTSTAVMRTKDLKSFPQHLRSALMADTLIHAWASFHGKLFKLPMATGVWCKSTGGIWNGISKEEQREATMIFFDLLDTMNKEPWFQEQLKQARDFYDIMTDARAIKQLDQIGIKIEKLKEALALYPEDPNLKIDLCGAYIRSGDLDAAEKVLDVLSEFDPHHPDTLFLHARLNTAKSKPKIADRFIKQCSKLYPGFYRAANFQIEHLIKEQEFDKAKKLLAKNTNLPDHYIHKHLGVIHSKSFQFQSALDEFEKIPDGIFSGLLHHKAVCHFKMHDYKKSLECLDTLLADFPNHKGAQTLHDRVSRAFAETDDFRY